MTNETTNETTLIGIITGDGNPPTTKKQEEEKSCHGAFVSGRVSTPDILNWIKQHIAEA